VAPVIEKLGSTLPVESYLVIVRAFFYLHLIVKISAPPIGQYLYKFRSRYSGRSIAIGINIIPKIAEPPFPLLIPNNKY
jgi:hypothetical protein